MTFNDDMQKEVDSTVETFSTYAKKAGYSTSAYLKLMYGNNMTMSTFKSILKDTLLASHYQQGLHRQPHLHRRGSGDLL